MHRIVTSTKSSSKDTKQECEPALINVEKSQLIWKEELWQLRLLGKIVSLFHKTIQA